jgi:hypothetical protein
MKGEITMSRDWEEVSKAMVCVFVVAFTVSLFLYAFSSKQHKGYYLSNFRGEHQIYINWENAPDEVAFRTYNEKEAITVFEKLKEIENK